MEIQFSEKCCCCKYKLNFSQVSRLTQDIDITLHKLTETTSLRTVSSPYISHLKCLKRSRKLIGIIGIIPGKRYSQVIAETGICQIVLCFCSIQFQFFTSLHDLEDQFFIFTALLAAEILNMFYTGSLDRGKTKGSVRLSDHIHHIVTDCHFLR